MTFNITIQVRSNEHGTVSTYSFPMDADNIVEARSKAQDYAEWCELSVLSVEAEQS